MLARSHTSPSGAPGALVPLAPGTGLAKHSQSAVAAVGPLQPIAAMKIPNRGHVLHQAAGVLVLLGPTPCCEGRQGLQVHVTGLPSTDLGRPRHGEAAGLSLYARSPAPAPKKAPRDGKDLPAAPGSEAPAGYGVLAGKLHDAKLSNCGRVDGRIPTTHSRRLASCVAMRTLMLWTGRIARHVPYMQHPTSILRTSRA